MLFNPGRNRTPIVSKAGWWPFAICTGACKPSQTQQHIWCKGRPPNASWQHRGPLSSSIDVSVILTWTVRQRCVSTHVAARCLLGQISTIQPSRHTAGSRSIVTALCTGCTPAGSTATSSCLGPAAHLCPVCVCFIHPPNVVHCPVSSGCSQAVVLVLHVEVQVGPAALDAAPVMEQLGSCPRVGTEL
jgi:hypothetical protein